ncbi:MAG: single-stranded DNA-binding protein [Clostridiales bacterium]|jgi:single-stranded DNA-binding protein|nr:single-stranded DNA-binding protein [Clostridiales bacterium]
MNNKETLLLENNKVYLYGQVVSQPVFSHELYDEQFYEFLLEVSRLSDMKDILPVTVSERLLKDINLQTGATIALTGQFRSYNKIIENRSKLMLTVFVRDFVEAVESNPNVVELKGYICKPPVYRTTPFSREICDMLLAVNRSYNKSDYIPCIAWGRNARFVRDIQVGQKLTILGRIQSREYVKRLSDNQSVSKVAYEVSINKISLVSMDNQTSVVQQVNRLFADAAFASDIMLPQSVVLDEKKDNA